MLKILSQKNNMFIVTPHKVIFDCFSHATGRYRDMKTYVMHAAKLWPSQNAQICRWQWCSSVVWNGDANTSTWRWTRAIIWIREMFLLLSCSWNVAVGLRNQVLFQIFHALRRCDNVSVFAGTYTCPMLTSQEKLHIIEWIVILLCDLKSTCSDVDKTRNKLVAKRKTKERIPPMHVALEQHVKRAVCQSGYIWGQSLLPRPAIPSLTNCDQI